MKKRSKTWKTKRAVRNPAEKGLKRKPAVPGDKTLSALNTGEMKIESLKAMLSQKQTELDELYQKYAELNEFTPGGHVTVSDTGVIIETNTTAAEMLGRRKNSLTGTAFASFLSSRDVTRFFELLRICKTSYEQSSDEFKIRSRGRRSTDIILTVLPGYEYKTKKLLYHISLMDITARKNDQRAVEESEKRFRLMADASPVMIWMTDMNGRLEYMNKTRLKFVGKEAGELIRGKWLETIHPDDTAEFLETLLKAAHEKKVYSVEVRLKNLEGIFCWILDTIAPRFLENGTFIGLIGSGIDITREKNARIKLQKSLEEKEVLLKEIHHRVKNNLQIISSLLHLQSFYIKDKAIAEIFKSSQNRIKSMALLHEKLYRSGSLSEINIRDYLNDLVLSLFKLYRPGNIHFNIDIADVHPEIDLCIAIGLIINELVTNSLKHAFKNRKEGEITVKLFPKDSGQLQLLVSDNGDGIPEDYKINRDHSFGLELVEVLTQQHNGSVELFRNGKTEFQISLHI